MAKPPDGGGHGNIDKRPTADDQARARKFLADQKAAKAEAARKAAETAAREKAALEAIRRKR